MSWLGDKLERIGNLPGPHRALLKFDAGTIRGASIVGQKLFGNNVVGHMFDWGRQEGEKNLANPGRQFSKGAQFYLGSLVAGALAGYGGAGAGETTGGSVDNALATWGTDTGPYAGSADWAAPVAAGAGAATDTTGGTNTTQTPTSTTPAEATKTTGEKSALKDIGRSVAIGVGTNVATSLLTPKPKEPAVTPPTEMPDPLAQEQAARKKRIEMLARRGRAASILTDTGY